MNYMKQVAHMLGVEIGEEFRVDRIGRKNVVYKIEADGLYSRQIDEDPIWCWWRNSIGNRLYELLLGDVNIIKKSEENDGE